MTTRLAVVLAALGLLLGGIVTFSLMPESAATIPNLEYVHAEQDLGAGQQGAVVAECSSGKKALGGGFFAGSPDVEVYGSTPYGVTVQGDAWAGYFKNNGSQAWQIQAWAVCATV